MSRPPYLQPARPPAQCTCAPRAVPALEDTLHCPALWQEMPDGIWVHIWPPRKRRMTRKGTR